jgi:enoyl-CoA hydratase/carnithine racemase
MEFSRIIYEKRDHIAYLTINRPDALNALDGQANYELHQAFLDFRDDNNLWVAIITGAGDKAFCSGMDLRAAGAGGAAAPRAPFGGLVRDVEIYKPIIAAINGYCLGGGVEMSLCCDLRVASENARFGLPEVRWGIIPGGGGTQRVPMHLQLSKALEMILLGEQIDAMEAYRIGLVNKVVPADQLMTTAEKWANTILERAPLAVQAAKEAIMRSREMTLDAGLRFESLLSARMMATEDRAEGMKSFAEKRKPNFKGK